MAVEVIRNLLNQSDKTLLNIKKKVKEESKKKLLKLQEQLPNKEEITSRIKANTCNTETANLVDKNFNNVKDKLNFLNNKLGGGLDKLRALEAKIEVINGWIAKIEKILSLLDPILRLLKRIIKVLPKALAFLSGLAANGFAIKKISDLIDKAKSKIENLSNSVTSFKFAILNFLNRLNPLSNLLAKAMAALQSIIDKISSLMSILEQLYLFYLAQCNLPSNPVNADGSINDGTLDLVIEGLEQENKSEIIEKIYDANFETIGYRRYKI